MHKFLFLIWITLAGSGLFAAPTCAGPPAPVTATEDATRIMMDNGIVRLEVSRAKGNIVSVRYRHDGQDVGTLRLTKSGSAAYLR